MPYCEFWLEMQETSNSFRVMLLLPNGYDPPQGYTLVESQQNASGKQLYSSVWFAGISAAEENMGDTAQRYRERNVKVLLFREIRPGCSDTLRPEDRKKQRSKKK